MPAKIADRLLTHYRLVLTILLLIGAFLRIVGINNVSPPGLEHDEVAHWLINLDILSGNHGIYFAEAYGHEAGFHYVQTIFMALMGDNALVLRLPSAFAGMLLVALSFALARRLFGLKIALISAGLGAVLFWPVFYSRLALRAISLPLVSGLSLLFFWKGWESSLNRNVPGRTQRTGWIWGLRSPYRSFILAGFLGGLTLYTYMAARAVPIFYMLFVIYLFIFHRPEFRRRQWAIALFLLVYLVTAAPLALYLLSNPGLEVRISEVDAPLRSLASGHLGPVLQNSERIFIMFGLRGDGLWRQNVARLPVFEPVVALFFYIGLFISAWKWREPPYLLLILWLFVSSIPSILTIDAPSSIRMVNALPVITIFPAIGMRVIHCLSPLSTVSGRLSTKFGHNLGFFLILLVLLVNIGRTARAIYGIWPTEEEVQFVWQQALTKAAGYIDALDKRAPIAVGGWSPGDMDPATMLLTLRFDEHQLRYYDPRSAVIIPSGDQGQTARLIRPAVLPLEPNIEALLLSGRVQEQIKDTFVVYHVPNDYWIEPETMKDISFEGQISLFGYDLLSGCSPEGGDEIEGGSSSTCRLLTFWRVEQPATVPLRFYLHLVDEDGNLISQDDRLGAPSKHWRAGDVIVQYHELPIPDNVAARNLLLGIYNPDNGRRLLAEDGSDAISIEYTFVDNGDD